ncbi:MAG: GNAT family N-acetyltransferase [Bacilli bacterium]
MEKIDNNIKKFNDGEIELRLSLGLVSTKQFYYIIYKLSDNTKIGQCGIRLIKSEENYYLGNIEYEIFNKNNGHNYAQKASKLLANVAIYYNVDKLIITANPNNIPSIKTIENLNAKFLEIKKVPKHTKLYKSGSKKVAIYEWDLKERGIK